MTRDNDVPPEPREVRRLSHVAEDGSARMVDVSAKEASARFAAATGRVRLSGEAAAAVRDQALPKGDVLTIARIAGIQAAKRTWELIPLCHPIGLTGIDVDVALVGEEVQVAVRTRTHDRTGVEMEALTAVAVAGLTIIDMVKAIDPGATITDVSVESKGGGVHGEWHREPRE
jgi:cyclic pyranopterin phosphate synthase